MLSKIAISGMIKNSPEKRFTTNNTAITSFILEHKENTQFKVICFGKLAEAASEFKKDTLVFINGNLEITKVKNEAGAETSKFLINAKNIETSLPF
jgi:single-stranded DNA-binding protein